MSEATSPSTARALSNILLDESVLPDCIIAYNESSTRAIIEVANEKGLKFPIDLALIGVGCGVPIKYEGNSVTTIAVPENVVASRLTQYMLNLIQDRSVNSFVDKAIPTKLIPGSTT